MRFIGDAIHFTITWATPFTKCYGSAYIKYIHKTKTQNRYPPKIFMIVRKFYSHITLNIYLLNDVGGTGARA